jgi:hypothetical protein
MNKIKTKELLNEVINHIRNNLEYEVMESFSDYGDKNSVFEELKNVSDTNRDGTEFVNKCKPICEFSVFNKYRKDNFVIWDWRDDQPFYNNKNCVYSGAFGRYEFKNREEFYSYIKSEWGEV